MLLKVLNVLYMNKLSTLSTLTINNSKKRDTYSEAQQCESLGRPLSEFAP